jgi:hypothetical protein
VAGEAASREDRLHVLVEIDMADGGKLRGVMTAARGPEQESSEKKRAEPATCSAAPLGCTISQPTQARIYWQSKVLLGLFSTRVEIAYMD